MNNPKAWTVLQQAWANEKNLLGWGRLVQAWALAHVNYCSAVPGDSAWYFKEHPSRGLLGTAAFLAGGVSLQEWPTKKKNCYGRNDLWIRLLPQNNEADFFIEAKHCWIDLTSKFGRAKESLDEACLNADALGLCEGSAVGVSFGSLTIKQKTSHSDLEKSG